MELSNRHFVLALAINTAALALVSILVAVAILPDNWIISPLYILLCSLAHRPLFKFTVKRLLVLQAMTFLLFIVLNWLLLTVILSFATI